MRVHDSAGDNLFPVAVSNCAMRAGPGETAMRVVCISATKANYCEVLCERDRQEVDVGGLI